MFVVHFSGRRELRALYKQLMMQMYVRFLPEHSDSSDHCTGKGDYAKKQNKRKQTSYGMPMGKVSPSTIVQEQVC